MSNEKSNVIQLFKDNSSNVVNLPKRKAPNNSESSQSFIKKVSGGSPLENQSLIREGFESCLISKSGFFSGNVKLFVLYADGRFEKAQPEPFKDKIEMLKFAFANFDTNKVDFKPLIG